MAKRTFDEIAAAQGWNEASQLALLRQYIDNQQDDDALADFAEQQAQDENSVDVDRIEREMRRKDNYPSDVAAEVAALRPDLCATDAVATVLTADPTLTAKEVIAVLDEATAEDAAAVCPHCGSRNTNELDGTERECYDCGESYEV